MKDYFDGLSKLIDTVFNHRPASWNDEPPSIEKTGLYGVNVFCTNCKGRGKLWVAKGRLMPSGPFRCSNCGCLTGRPL